MTHLKAMLASAGLAGLAVLSACGGSETTGTGSNLIEAQNAAGDATTNDMAAPEHNMAAMPDGAADPDESGAKIKIAPRAPPAKDPMEGHDMANMSNMSR